MVAEAYDRLYEEKTMKLKLSYNSQEDIPNGYEALYTEKDGKRYCAYGGWLYPVDDK